MSTITAPLARDADGNAIELPDKAAFWEVMRPTGGRPSKVVVGRDKEQLYIAIADDEDALLVNGCSGAILLRAVDAQKKSVGAPLVCIDLGSPTTAIVPADHAPADLARTAVEGNTRSMEAMQRAQIERERTSAQRERSMADVISAALRSQHEVIVALVERLSPGKPLDPVTVLKKQLEIQDALGWNTSRNVPPVADEPALAGPNSPWWWQELKPYAPAIAVRLQDLLAKNVPKGEPEKGESESPTRDATPRPAPPKAIREVQALLDDGEADTFETYLESASDDAYRAFCDKAAAIPDLEARVAWARELVAAYKRLQNAQTVNESPANEPTRTPSNEITVPPALIPALVQLAAEEKQILQQLLGVLDRATTERAIAELSALPTEQAVARIRRIIDEAKRRSASVAQRAFASGLRSEDNSGSTNGGAA